MHIDYAGTSPQIDRGINCVSTTPTPIRSIRSNARSIRSRRATRARIRPSPLPRRKARILNPRFPAPVRRAAADRPSARRRHLPRACRKSMPDQIIAECGGAPSMRAVFSGARPQRRPLQPDPVRERRHGGIAASATGFPPPRFRPMSAPAASRPSRASRRWWYGESSCVPDSGGAGRFRGGLGQEVEIEVRSPSPVRLSLLSDRRDHPGAWRARRRQRRAGR